VRRSILIYGSLAALAGLYFASRTQRGQEVSLDVLEFMDVNARKVITAVEGWSLPAAGERFRALFDKATAQFSLPPGLLSRVAYQESHFREDVITGAKVSSAGALGIMQLIPRWFPGVDPLAPEQAIPAAAKELRALYTRFNSWPLALAAYNWGQGNLSKALAGGGQWPEETRVYVNDIAGDLGLLA
jgi:soluble lytic murein transglycosylase-like protein